jgi:hypothetical protein
MSDNQKNEHEEVVGIEPIPPRINWREQVAFLTIPQFFSLLIFSLFILFNILSTFRGNWQMLSVPIGIWLVLARPNGEDSIGGMLGDNFRYLFNQQRFERKALVRLAYEMGDESGENEGVVRSNTMEQRQIDETKGGEGNEAVEKKAENETEKDEE